MGVTYIFVKCCVLVSTEGHLYFVICMLYSSVVVVRKEECEKCDQLKFPPFLSSSHYLSHADQL